MYEEPLATTRVMGNWVFEMRGRFTPAAPSAAGNYHLKTRPLCLVADDVPEVAMFFNRAGTLVVPTRVGDTSEAKVDSDYLDERSSPIAGPALVNSPPQSLFVSAIPYKPMKPGEEIKAINPHLTSAIGAAKTVTGRLGGIASGGVQQVHVPQHPGLDQFIPEGLRDTVKEGVNQAREVIGSAFEEGEQGRRLRGGGRAAPGGDLLQPWVIRFAGDDFGGEGINLDRLLRPIPGYPDFREVPLRQLASPSIQAIRDALAR